MRCVNVRFANHLGPILRGWNDDRSRTSLGSWGLTVSPPFLCSLPPHNPIRSQAQPSLRRKDVGFSAPGGRGPLEACETTSCGLELVSTCLTTTLTALPKSAVLGDPSRSSARYGCGRPGRLRDLPANSTSAGGWGEMEFAPGLQAVYRSPPLPASANAYSSGNNPSSLPP